MKIRNLMDAIYRDLAPDKIPWNIEDPPELLVELVESKWVQPCRAIDLGCGAGNYAAWLAGRGFQMTGLDISPKAIELADRLAKIKRVECQFIARDLMEEPGELAGSFDFAFDWEVLHHIFPEDRETYIRNVHGLLHPDGRYLSVCFSEADPEFGGKGKYRETPLGTTLYFSSESELRELFEPYFIVHKLYTSEVSGKYGPHRAVIAQMERKKRS